MGTTSPIARIRQTHSSRSAAHRLVGRLTAEGRRTGVQPLENVGNVGVQLGLNQLPVPFLER